MLPKFLAEISAENSGNMVGTSYPQNVRVRGFMKFYVLFAELWPFKVCQKVWKILTFRTLGNSYELVL